MDYPPAIWDVGATNRIRDPDSVMDALPLRMPSVFDEWRTPFWGENVVIGGPLLPRSWVYVPRVPPLAWEEAYDSAVGELIARVDTHLVMNLRRFRSPPPRPRLPPNKKRAAKRAKRPEQKARTQERRAHQRRMR